MMRRHQITDRFSVSNQITPADVANLAEAGVSLIVCNRPDGEAANQPPFSAINAAAEQAGISAVAIAFKSGELRKEQLNDFREMLAGKENIHAYCRTGNRSFSVYAAAAASTGVPQQDILEQSRLVGFDVAELIRPYYKEQTMNSDKIVNINSGGKPSYDIVVVGAGSGGIAVAASLLKRNGKLRIALIDPATDHYYQPGWTMVGGGVFDAGQTHRKTRDLIPDKVDWVNQAAVEFKPSSNEVKLENGESLHYRHLVVAPGLTLDWAAIEGLEETLGRNGVTSNYSYKTAPYTWELVQSLKNGRALFTQPSMPIKCAGAPQKAMYLSCDYWLRNGVLKDIEVEFHNAGGVLFGVSDFVPALQTYVDKYDIDLCFNENLTAIDGDKKIAYFKPVNAENETALVAREFDMIHICPPQRAPKFVAESELADSTGWLDVDQFTLRHKRFENIWGLGDVMNAPNAKTMAAVRKQVPVVAQNIIDAMHNNEPAVGYDGYGSCPLTVERGKIVLAEFGYGGKLLPSFPSWLNDGTKPTRMAWILKADVLPGVYWHAMLKGREWLAKPKKLEDVAA